IPSRVVKGFRGAEGRGDGWYDVRNSHAHSWAEVLVPRPGPDGQPVTGPDGEPEVCWLTLDPTPSGAGPVVPPFSLAQWWESRQRLGAQFWQLIVDYSADDQLDLLTDLWESLAGRAGAGGRNRFRLGPVLTAAGALSLLAALAAVTW